jgi:hypothetical protein
MGIIGLGALFGVLIAPSTLWAADPKIDLAVQGNKLTFLNSECPSDPGYNGCVEVARGSKNWIMWELDHDAVRAGWVLTGLQLKLHQIADPAIRQCVLEDFNVDPGSGFANDFQVQGNGRFGQNWDNNDCPMEYEVAYLVYARNEQTGEEANSDPIIKNGGRN